jgi:hypothetical protein
VAALWTEDGAQLLEPPREARDAAAELVIGAVFEARGHAALEARVTRAYEQFVASGEYVFRPRGEARRVRDAVKLAWEAVQTGDGEVAGWGVDLLLLDADGRIRLDYQFIN